MSNSENLQPGDVVYLKSGSQPMTINTVDGELVKCNWFDKAEGLLSAVFPLNGLTKIKPEYQ